MGSVYKILEAFYRCQAGDKGAKSGKVCPNNRELARNYCFELWHKQLELNFGESIKIVQG